ncbi:MAG: hypothetical protein RL236_1722 [Pseudomonadota bacterium]|jgi:methyl-accepting chemotaxis protein
MMAKSKKNIDFKSRAGAIVFLSIGAILLADACALFLNDYLEMQLGTYKESVFFGSVILITLCSQWLLVLEIQKPQPFSREERRVASSDKLRYVLNRIILSVESKGPHKLAETSTNTLAIILAKSAEALAEQVRVLIDVLQSEGNETLETAIQALSPQIEQTADAVTDYLNVSQNIDVQLVTLMSETKALLLDLQSGLKDFSLPPVVEESPQLVECIRETYELVDCHLQIENVVNEQLKIIANDTNDSALQLVMSMRDLNVSAQDLVVYISDALIKINEMESGVNDSVEFIVKIGNLIQEIPDKIQQDIQSVQGVGSVINELGYLVDSIKEISFQTDILAVNAAIQAAHAGEAGLGFKIVADEVRKLAVSSNSAAEMIEAGLATARLTIQNGLKFRFLDEIMTQMNEASHVMDAIKKLEETRENSRQFYKTLFGVINLNNKKIAENISDILSSIQYQDIVSQRIERMCDILKQRSDLFQLFIEELESSNGNLEDDFSGKMNSILVDYIELESNHHNSLNSVDSSPKFELF